MRSICILCILANSALGEVNRTHHRLIPHPEGKTMRDWMKDTNCLNVASQPLMNTQFAQLGALDALKDAGVLDKVTGYSGVSSGAFVMAIAATKDFSYNSRKFREIWPGWSNIVPDAVGGGHADPHLSYHYWDRVLKHVMPQFFEQLKVPLAVTAVAYDDEQAAAMIDETRAQPMVISDGHLPKSVIASSSAMTGPGCPRCLSGFQAKDFRGHWPVADGFLKDEYGTLGLSALPKCGNLLHFQPQNFAQQLSPTRNSDLDTQPDNVVSLGIDVPSSGIMSMMWDGLLKPINNIRRATLQGSMPLGKIANQDEIWEKLQYETAYDHMTEMLDQPMQVHKEPMKDDNGAAEKHFFVDLDLKKHYDNIRGWGERKWDQKFDTQHAEYWDKTVERRNKMVGERNKLLKSGELSFRACGNGKGAPVCNEKREPISAKLMAWPKAKPDEAPKPEVFLKEEAVEGGSRTGLLDTPPEHTMPVAIAKGIGNAIRANLLGEHTTDLVAT